jgi:hypothetical protein
MPLSAHARTARSGSMVRRRRAMRRICSRIFNHVIDQWYTEQVRPRLRGSSSLVRFCDDFVMLFAHKVDAERVLAVLDKRLGKFGLQLHPDKTRLVDFRPRRSEREIEESTLPTTFNFLGFTHVWGKSRKGAVVVWQLTAKDRLARSLKAINQRCKRMLHWPLRTQHQRLCRVLKGHYAYFGITGNFKRLNLLHYQVRTAQRARLASRLDRAAARPRRAKPGPGRIQPGATFSRAAQDDAGLGGLLGPAKTCHRWGGESKNAGGVGAANSSNAGVRPRRRSAPLDRVYRRFYSDR